MLLTLLLLYLFDIHVHSDVSWYTWGAWENLLQLVSFFYHGGSRDQTQNFSFGARFPLLSYQSKVLKLLNKYQCRKKDASFVYHDWVTNYNSSKPVLKFLCLGPQKENLWSYDFPILNWIIVTFWYIKQLNSWVIFVFSSFYFLFLLMPLSFLLSADFLLYLRLQGGNWVKKFSDHFSDHIPPLKKCPFLPHMSRNNSPLLKLWENILFKNYFIDSKIWLMQVYLFMCLIFTYVICKWIFDTYNFSGQQWGFLYLCPYAG